MAEVFLARDEVLGRHVALKVLRDHHSGDAGFVERLRREARSAASLSHPNVVRVFDAGCCSEDGRHYMVMEYVPGGTLKQKIEEAGPLDPAEAVRITRQVALALGVAHEAGVIHRDIKPQNVLLGADGTAKVADFGIARAVAASPTTSLVLGTAAYMSPEQAMGEALGPQSDLYSLGVVLYEMLTGEMPYDAETPIGIAVKHVNEPPRAPAEANPRVPAILNALTLRLMAKRAEDRPASAAEVVRDLERARAEVSSAFARSAVAGAPAGPPRRRGRSVRGAALKFVAALVPVAAVLGGGAWALSSFDAQNPPGFAVLTGDEAEIKGQAAKPLPEPLPDAAEVEESEPAEEDEENSAREAEDESEVAKPEEPEQPESVPVELASEVDVAPETEQYAEDTQYAAGSQYAIEDQYAAEPRDTNEEQYVAEEQYGVDEQYTSEEQYTTDEQYLAEERYEPPVADDQATEQEVEDAVAEAAEPEAAEPAATRPEAGAEKASGDREELEPEVGIDATPTKAVGQRPSERTRVQAASSKLAAARQADARQAAEQRTAAAQKAGGSDGWQDGAASGGGTAKKAAMEKAGSQQAAPVKATTPRPTVGRGAGETAGTASKAGGRTGTAQETAASPSATSGHMGAKQTAKPAAEAGTAGGAKQAERATATQAASAKPQAAIKTGG